ncbi:MAG: phosphodiesterase family [Fusobacteria bacterium]|nr:MAG: phosphodiesterase family [Fusobacteriota bacterium]KAF0230128.1 MAG: phosphodiesterase [Fusobacteriota bacterium]
MVRLLVISDTHCPSKKIPGKLFELLMDKAGIFLFDGLIHCGDIQEIECYEDLIRIGIPVYAVLGNNYDFMLERQVPKRRVLFFENISIGIVHGNGSFSKAIDNAKKEFAGESIDLICYGHSHIANIKNIGEVAFLNPGSLTHSRNGVNTYGVIEINGSNIKLKLETFD